MNVKQTFDRAIPTDYASPVVDYKAVLVTLRRRWLLLAAVTVAVTLAIFIPIALQPKQYTATASVMIDPRGTNVTPDKEVVGDLPTDTATIDTEVEVLKSNALVEQVTRSLHLDRDPEFNPDVKGHESESVQDSRIIPQLVLDNVGKALSIRREGLTRLIYIDFSSQSPNRSSQAANGFVQAYLDNQVHDKNSATDAASQALSARLGELRDQVQNAESAVAQYKIANNLMSSEGNTLTEQEISDLNKQEATVKVDQAESVARLNTAKKQLAAGSNGEDVGEALNSPVIQALKQQRAQVTSQLAELQTRYGPQHPDVLKAQSQLKDIDQQIRDEIQRLISNLQAQADVQSRRTASLMGSLSAAKGTLASNNRANVHLLELQRDADAAQTLYQSYLDRYKQTVAQQSIGGHAYARIVQNATTPVKPSSPKMALAAALALFGGLAAGGASVVGVTAMSSVITTSDDVERKLGAPALASIPLLASTLKAGDKRLPPAKYIVAKPLSAFAEGFRSLRASVIYAPSREGVRTIAITSAIPGEGKTTTSICLAQTMVLSGQTAIVVDCDLRRRSVSETLNVPNNIGMLEYMQGKIGLDQCIIGDDFSQVKYMPLSSQGTTAEDIFGSPRFAEMLEALKEKFDVIVLDTAPLLPVVDTRIIAHCVDAVVVLARWRSTPIKAIEAAYNLLKDSTDKIAGIAITQVNVKEQARTGYGDAGFYYKHYKKYYQE